MKFREVLGIDVSKKTLDIYLHCSSKHKVFANDCQGYLLLIEWLGKQGIPREALLVCFENTGIYSRSLADFLWHNGFNYVMENALQIKRSMGIVRGKTDKVDARLIAKYAYLRKEELELSQPKGQLIKAVSDLLTLRDRMVKQRAGYKAFLKELLLGQDHSDLLVGIHQRLIETLSEEIQSIHTQILALIKSDAMIENQYQLISSIKGVGFVAACYFIVSTDAFKRFKNHRRFASYCGVAPFKHQSGSSIKGKTRISHLANKKMKNILNMTAMAAINHNKELKRYYQNRVEQGKNKMSTINIIRNKIIARVFAVINRNSPYVEINKFAA
ncbi:IS110 family RNA-guided transposase [Flavivirga eckloniae]|uniref:IS110 family transposase n=1 Tax=Flavivirga eckloniae TaxID=1803846 RepID=A0A2K9PUG8_9FLAO|nr:IS110 family transposase [Flavivirga eckloniae]AUP80694.1 IS110 family transposase [Flavivirga eckloniae]